MVNSYAGVPSAAAARVVPPRLDFSTLIGVRLEDIVPSTQSGTCDGTLTLIIKGELHCTSMNCPATQQVMNASGFLRLTPVGSMGGEKNGDWMRKDGRCSSQEHQ